MQRIMQAQALGDSQRQAYMQGKKTMEINPRHPLIVGLLDAVKANEDDAEAADTARLLFETALLESGYPMSDQQAFAARVRARERRSVAAARASARPAGIVTLFWCHGSQQLKPLQSCALCWIQEQRTEMWWRAHPIDVPCMQVYRLMKEQLGIERDLGDLHPEIELDDSDEAGDGDSKAGDADAAGTPDIDLGGGEAFESLQTDEL